MIPASASEGHVVKIPGGYAPAGGWSIAPQEFSVEKVFPSSDDEMVRLIGRYPGVPGAHLIRVPSDLELEVIE